ncbi:NUDIX hydrolase [Spartinivicinus poritis]|uniref:NUDIX domain-containing protein n=1 Tax=Spartinivicinus poritis TaxID=2994640 RepID=A0ABT5U672_9GAMM|nr:NUDIX domain-containing protein [Spartinivicinus sp. A2-2]MDE1460963.1 NUDIX domain-containing protein [Spartinivicinus sp. A2-2]
MKEIDKLAWIFIKDKKILGTRSKGKDTYYIPGGKREVGETDQAALIREIKEELSIELKPETLEYIATFKAQAHGRSEGTQVKMTCYLAEFSGEIRAHAEIEEVKWLGHQDKQNCSLVSSKIMEWLYSKGHIA